MTEQPGDEPDVVADDKATSDADAQTERAKQLQKQTKPTRKDVTSDEGSDGQGSGGLPGVEAFGAVSGVAPFLALVKLYANNLYPRRKGERSRFHAFVKDHPHLVRAAFALDSLVRVILTVLILLVILKGVLPLPFPSDLSWLPGLQ